MSDKAIFDRMEGCNVMEVLIIIVILAVVCIKEALTPSKPAIKDIDEHLNIILSLPTVKARQDYLRKM